MLFRSVTRDRMYIDAMQDVYSHVTKVMVDTHGGNNLIQLPLDRLTQAAAAANAPAPAAPAAADPNAASTVTVTPADPNATATVTVTPTDPSADARSRDNSRGRDRDSR